MYIHGKTMVVDDREFRRAPLTGSNQRGRACPHCTVTLTEASLAGLVICGSANINERSQRGDRDSEIVAVIRDTDMIDG